MAGQGFSDADNQAPLYFKPTQEMLEEFSYLGTQKAFEIVVRTRTGSRKCAKSFAPARGDLSASIEGSAEDLQRICYTHAREPSTATPFQRRSRTALRRSFTDHP